MVYYAVKTRAAAEASPDAMLPAVDHLWSKLGFTILAALNSKRDGEVASESLTG